MGADDFLEELLDNFAAVEGTAVFVPVPFDSNSENERDGGEDTLVDEDLLTPGRELTEGEEAELAEGKVPTMGPLDP